MDKTKIMIDGKLSPSTDRKKNAPVFKTPYSYIFPFK